MTVSKEEIVDFNDADEVEEGYPKVASGPYLARATESTVGVSKASGNPMVEYTPVLLESSNDDDPTQDKNGLEIKNFKLPKDRIILFANPVYSRGPNEGKVKDAATLAKDNKTAMGKARGIVRKMTGEDFTPKGTRVEVAQELANAIKGATFVAVVSLQPEQKEKGFPAKNVVREHKAEEDWQGA